MPTLMLATINSECNKDYHKHTVVEKVLEIRGRAAHSLLCGVVSISAYITYRKFVIYIDAGEWLKSSLMTGSQITIPCLDPASLNCKYQDRIRS